MNDATDFALVREAHDALLRGNFSASLEYMARFLRDKPVLCGEQRLKEALNLIERDYRDDVTGVAEELASEWRAGDAGDRDDFMHAIEQSVEATQRVIYTYQAQLCLLASGNASAGPDELGADNFDWSAGVPWSQLAFWALRADVIEALRQDGVDVNEYPPSSALVLCDTCTEWKEATEKDGDKTCVECHATQEGSA